MPHRAWKPLFRCRTGYNETSENVASEAFAALVPFRHSFVGPFPATIVIAIMKRFSRRMFLAASAAVTAAPALAQTGKQKNQPSGPFDAVIVGAGAAGIAAARRLVAAGRRVAIVEAAAQPGGRCITDTST